MSKRKKIAAAVLVLSLLAAALLIFLGISELQDRRAGQDYYAGLLTYAALPSPETATTATALPEVPATAEPSAAETVSPVPPATAAPTATAAPEEPAPTGTPAPTATSAPATSVPTATSALTATPASPATSAPTTPALAATSALTTSVPTATPAPTAITASTPTPSPAAAVLTATPAPTAAPVPTPTPSPTTAPAPASAMDFAALRQVIPDIVGWIVIDGTNISYPIVQGTDNAFYLNHLPDGTANRSGSIMMDARNTPDWSDELNVIHGHRMRTGDMFGSLSLFAEAEYAEKHLTMVLYTPQGDYRIELIAACTVDGMELGFPVYFRDDAAFDAYVHYLTARSEYQADFTPVRGDRLIILSTCAYVYDNARFVLLGRLVPLAD